MAAPSVAPEPAPPAPAASAAPAARTVQLRIDPSDATVRVDGVPAKVSNATIELSGPLGSTYDVELSKGNRRSHARVAISERGAVPLGISLALESDSSTPTPASAPAAHAPPRAPARPPAREKPTSPQPAVSQPTAKPGVGVITDFE